jgi:hypothetical protein
VLQRLGAAALLAGAPAVPAVAACARGATCPGGSFWQPLLTDLTRDAAAWRRWVTDLAASGVHRLVIQHVALEPYDVLVPRDSSLRAPSEVDPGGFALAQILDAAHDRAVQVWLGLSYDPAYFQRVAADSAAPVEPYLRQRLDRVAVLARALATAARHPAVRGWYLPDEIDDLSWARPERESLLADWMARATRLLQREAPAAQIAISGFVDAARTAPLALAAQWQRRFASVPLLDEVLFQDGVGAGTVALSDSGRYLEAMTAAASMAGRRCTPVVELFEPAGVAAAGRAPAFRSAAFERVREQIRVACRFAPDWVAFSVPEYLQAATPEARALRAALAAGCA